MTEENEMTAVAEPETSTPETPTEPAAEAAPAPPAQQMSPEEAAAAVRAATRPKTDDETEAAMEDWRAGTDLVERVAELPDVQRWAQMEAMAGKLARSKLMPKHIRDSRDPEADLLVILLAAHDLGLSTTVALNKIAVIEGKPAMQAELQRMLVRRDGHDIWTEVVRDGAGIPVEAIAHGIRKDQPDRTHAASFTLEDAVIAGLCTIKEGRAFSRDGNGKAKPWERYTEDMLIARATSRLCRRVFEDCLAGISYTPEELGAIHVDALDDEQPGLPAPYQQAPQVVIDAFLARIALLDDEAKGKVRERWKSFKLRPLRPTPHAPSLLGIEEIDLASRVLDEIEREQPADAELVGEPGAGVHAFEGSETAQECATCGKGREDEAHAVPVEEAVEDDLTEEERTELEARRAAASVEVSSLKIGKVMEALVPFMAASGGTLPPNEAEMRTLLIDLLARRVMCDDCGKLQTGAARTDEEHCECPM